MAAAQNSSPKTCASHRHGCRHMPAHAQLPRLTKWHGRQRGRASAWRGGHGAGAQRCGGHSHRHGRPRHGWRRPRHGRRRQAARRGRPRRRWQAARHRRPRQGSCCRGWRCCGWRCCGRHTRRLRQRDPRRRRQRRPRRGRQAGRRARRLPRACRRRCLGRRRQAGRGCCHRRHLWQRLRRLWQRLGGALGHRHRQRGACRRRIPRPLLRNLLAHQGRHLLGGGAKDVGQRARQAHQVARNLVVAGCTREGEVGERGRPEQGAVLQVLPSPASAGTFHSAQGLSNTGELRWRMPTTRPPTSLTAAHSPHPMEAHPWLCP